MPEPDMHIRPLHALSLAEVDDLARAAADREVELQIDKTPA